MKVLVVSRQSKYEWERQNYNISHKGFIEKYGSQHSNLRSLLDSHYGLVNTREMFDSIMPSFDIITTDSLKQTISDYDVVVSLGGDDSFKYISHYVKDIPILSVNSDPSRSVGELTSCFISSKDSVIRIKECLDSSNFSVNNWARLGLSLDGKEIVSATSEYFLGDFRRNKMSTHIMVYDGNEYPQRCSGLIVATGAGSTGWFKSASQIKSWDPTHKVGCFIATEKYSGSDLLGNSGFIRNDEELVIRSMNNEGGIVSVDSCQEYKFIRGSEAIIKLTSPLSVIIPNTYI